MNEWTNNELVEQIKTLLEASRQKIAVEVNTTLLHTYWQIGKIIVEDEALHIGDAEYEKQSLRQLSKVLTTEFGKGFSRSNLSNMRQFYLTHKDVQTASGQFSMSKKRHCEPVTEVTGVAIRSLRIVFESFQRMRYGFPRQCAHWLGMTWVLRQSAL